jgi:pantoate--beta-alanine ligase
MCGACDGPVDCARRMPQPHGIQPVTCLSGLLAGHELLLFTAPQRRHPSKDCFVAAHPDVVTTVAELRQRVAAWRRAGEGVGLVPTMGALHDGHLSLVRAAKARVRRVVTSIFVNPAQFAPNEDFDKYPRTFDTDCAKLADVEGDLVWAPGVKEMYPEGFSTRIVPDGAAEGLETAFRPHFFSGVATVCCKLFTQVGANVAAFGEKDYQQLCVIRQMVRDLNLPLEIIGVPTIREPDGLAMSSRNRYLGADDRQRAVSLYRVIVSVAQGVAQGEDVADACRRATADLHTAGFGKIDYIEVRDAETLKPVPANAGRPLRVLAAAWLGNTRLIDNVPVGN